MLRCIVMISHQFLRTSGGVPGGVTLLGCHTICQTGEILYGCKSKHSVAAVADLPLLEALRSTPGFVVTPVDAEYDAFHQFCIIHDYRPAMNLGGITRIPAEMRSNFWKVVLNSRHTLFLWAE